MPESIHGRFVWHDLMTTDPERALAFYTELLDWKIERRQVQGFEYPEASCAGFRLGGFLPLEPGGPPSHWMGYIAVDDLESAIERLEGAGGTKMAGPLPIPDGGHFAICADPQGAAISIMQLDKPHSLPDQGDTTPGIPCWDELLSTDAEASAAFYGKVVGWTDETSDMGEMGVYHLQNAGSVQACGIMKSPVPEAPAFWTPYFNVADVDEGFARAKELGATPLNEPMDIPEVGRMAMMSDPTGAVFSLFKHAPKS